MIAQHPLRMMWFFALVLSSHAFRIHQQSLNLNAAAQDQVANEGNRSVIASAVAASLLLSATTSVLDATTRREAVSAVSDARHVEIQLFEARADHCVQAWKLHFQVATTELSLVAIMRVAPSGLGAELESDLVDIIEANLEEAGMLVLDACHGVTKADTALQQNVDDLDEAVEKVSEHQEKALTSLLKNTLKSMEKLTTWPASSKPSSNATPSEAGFPGELDFRHAVDAAIAALAVKDTITAGFQKKLLTNTMKLLKMLGLIVAVIAKAFGAILTAAVTNAFRSLTSVVADVQNLVDGDTNVFPAVVHLLYDATGLVEKVFKALAQSGLQSSLAASPAGVAVVQAHVCLMALSEALMLADAVVLRRKVRDLAIQAVTLEANAVMAYRREVKQGECADLYRMAESVQRQKIMLSEVIGLLQNHSDEQMSVGAYLLDFMRHFCTSYSQYCAQILSTDHLRKALQQDAELRSFAVSVRAKAAIEPVSDVVLIAHQHQALALLPLGFVDSGNVYGSGSTDVVSPQLLVCRGCGTFDVLSIRPGLANSTDKFVTSGHGTRVVSVQAPGIKPLTMFMAPHRQAAIVNTGGPEVLQNLQFVNSILESDTDEESADFDAAVAELATHTWGNSKTEIIATNSESFRQSLFLRTANLIGKFLSYDVDPLSSYHKLSILVATTGRRSMMEENRRYHEGPFRHLTVTRGWECALRENWEKGWNRLELPSLSRSSQERAAIRTDAWLHRQVEPPRSADFCLYCAVRRVRARLGQKIIDRLDQSEEPITKAERQAEKDVLKMASELKKGSERGCWTQQTVELPDGVWNGVVRKASQGPPDGDDWLLATTVDLYVEDDDWNYPVPEAVNVWYINQEVAAEEAVAPEAENLEALAMQIDTHARAIGCLTPRKRQTAQIA